MDFDPSAFLAMNMTEDQDAEYTAPDVPQEFSPAQIPEQIVVEGGLQLENNFQIPVPVFGLLQGNELMDGEGEANNENDTDRVEAPIHIDITDPETNATPQHSPGEKASSPCIRKIIPTSSEETRFRKELFNSHYERVKIFRLHCSICDKHLGCAPWFTERYMRTHKLLSVAVCRKCFEFYGDINFPTEDGSELFCCWCGEGGECFCCSTCPKIVCKKCVKRNLGPAKVKEIDDNDDWSCFVCKPEDIWPHRALVWGLQRWGKALRQHFSMLPKEEKQAKLSLDTSHCCPKTKDGVSLVGLPPKAALSKIPLLMIASTYQTRVKAELAREDTSIKGSNGFNSLNNHKSHGDLRLNNLSARIPETVTRVPGNFPNLPKPMVEYQVRQQFVQRNTVMINRPAPYPINRNMGQMLQTPLPSRYSQTPPQPQYPQFVQRVETHQYNAPPYAMLSPAGMSLPHPPSITHLQREAIQQQTSQPPLMDISSLERGVKEVKEVLRPTIVMLKQFEDAKCDLANDFSKLTSYYERLSFNIKIAICNLAKANTDLLESQKKIIDSRVSTVVNNIQSENMIQSSMVTNFKPHSVNYTVNSVKQNGHKPSPKGGSNPCLDVDSSPEIIEVNPNSPAKTPEPQNSSHREQPTVSTPSSSTAEDVGDVTIAMLCETVLEVEENKENKDNVNKDQPTPIKKPQPLSKKTVEGKPKSRKRPLQINEPSEIQVIDLVNDEEENGSFDESLWCKKFKIKPCKVVLERLEILKVDVV